MRKRFFFIALFLFATADCACADNGLLRELMGETARLFGYQDTIKIADSQVSVKDSSAILDSLSFLQDSTAVVEKDTTYRHILPDSVVAALAIPDSDLKQLVGTDSVVLANIALWYLDTVFHAQLDSALWHEFDSVHALLPDKRDIRRAERKNKRDYRDSVIKNTPRILDTYIIPDSLYYERMLVWSHDRYFNELSLKEVDTSYNYHFYDMPQVRNDVDAVYLGVSGSAMMATNYFERPHSKDASFVDTYLPYSYTPDNILLYNVKTPYTVLAYSGNPFIAKTKDENNLNLLSTQNITPSWNVTFEYNRYGGGGMLVREKTDNRTFNIGTNYIGKKYAMNAGYFGQSVSRKENGGIVDDFWIQDTVVEVKSIEVNLANASSELKRRTLFITQSLAVPINFFRKNADSLSVGDGTVAYIGHSGEFSRLNRLYEDVIAENDKFGRDFYLNQFNINSTKSHDSVAVRKFDNRFFIKLQPYAPDAVISKINAGIGYNIRNIYNFDPSVEEYKGSTDHNAYLYGGVSGMFRKYFKWDAFGRLDLTGHNAGDFFLSANAGISVYPIKDGIHLKGHFETSLREPDWFQNRICFNHHKWNNDFGKISESRLQATLDIPHWGLKAFANYALIDNMIYYDSLSTVRQNDGQVHVLSAGVEKNFKLWAFHFDNKVLFQQSSDNEVLPLPMLAANLKYYIQFNVVENVMEMQIGANAVFHTPYYMQAYSPDLNVFYNQNSKELGNAPYVEAFVNVQWKQACIYVKYTNVTSGWPSGDYFSAMHYVRPDKTLRIGIFWPFYVK